jgi:hypothetical protein
MKTAAPITRKLRCAVYTRKSSEERFEQEFNTVHAQREEAYVASQRAERWVLVPDRYDDGAPEKPLVRQPENKVDEVDLVDFSGRLVDAHRTGFGAKALSA